jgi:hypothetical protein
MSLDAGVPAAELGYDLAGARVRVESAWARTRELQQQTELLIAQGHALQQISADARRERRSAPAGRELLQHSAYARLLARLETMPVIEQAKGIIMTQSRCGPEEAFQLLRQASQRSNVPVRDLAAQIVAATAEPPPAPPRGRAGRAAAVREPHTS